MDINVIGVPIFYGCDNKGVEKGPEALRKENLLSLLRENNNIRDLGDISVNNIKEEYKYVDNNHLKYLNEVIRVNESLAEEVYTSLKDGFFPFIVGGDHSLGLGSIAGCSKYFGEDLGVIWVDAHGDINTEATSPSGNIHGMPLSASMGIGNKSLCDLYFKGRKINKDNVFIIGARDLDEGEKELIRELRLNVWTFSEIKEKGITKVLTELKEKISHRGLNNIHLSFDIDSLDPSFVPGTGTPVEDGFTLDQGKEVLKTILKTKKVKSLDFVEYNPDLDKTSKTSNTLCELLKVISKNL